MGYYNRPYSYEEYLDYIQNSPIWQSNRSEVFKRSNYSCENCHISGRALHCHHTPTAYKFKLGDEPTWSLKSLCYLCHKKLHQLQKELSSNSISWAELERKWNSL